MRASNARPYILVGSACSGCTNASLVQREVGCRLRQAGGIVCYGLQSTHGKRGNYGFLRSFDTELTQ